MPGPSTQNPHETWSSTLTFLLATIGFSVGLGNIWRFPYLAGEHGGGAFVLIYIICVFGIGIPIVMAELAIGRRGGLTPVGAIAKIAKEERKSTRWSWVGGLAILTGFLIVTFYCVIGGWTFHYVYLAVSGQLSGISAENAQDLFSELTTNPALLVFWQLTFIFANVVVVSRGLNQGVERAVLLLMPALFALLFGLALYGWFVGDRSQTLSFMFSPDFSRVSGQTILDAIGQAFFSVGVGMAAMMTYGAFLSRKTNIPSTAFIISAADTFVALIAGLAIFPFVFAFGLSPGEGPGLIFVTMPVALSNLLGGYAAIVLFLLMAVAALTSSIALFEMLASWGEEKNIHRLRSSLLTGTVCFLIGLGTVLSFNIGREFYPISFIPGYETATFFDVIDKFTSVIGLPLGGLFGALIAGWMLSSASIAEELGLSPNGIGFRCWRFSVRGPIPIIIAILMLNGVGG